MSDTDAYQLAKANVRKPWARRWLRARGLPFHERKGPKKPPSPAFELAMLIASAMRT